MSNISNFRVLAQSLRRPQSLPGDRGWLRIVVSRPIIFDLTSTIFQLRDLSRLKKIENGPEYADDFYEHVHSYNAGVTIKKIITRTRRAERLLPVLGLPPRDLSSERVLLVGPRNIHEILQVWLMGYRWRNIEGIDLYSTNPKIRVMNMEHMSYPEGTFDALFSSATLSYAKDISGCVREFIRVLKIGGRAAFMHSHVLGESEFSGNAISGEEVANAIRLHGGEIYYQNISQKTIRTGPEARVYEFGVVRRT